jgi:F420H(2)-dependent quinone reductase
MPVSDSPVAGRTGRPARQARIMRAANVPMRAILSLPFPTPLSRNLMLLHYTGRKTGNAYRQPVSYARDGSDLSEGTVLLTPGGGKWTLSLAGGRPVRLRLRGREVPARPELITDAGEVDRLFGVIARENPQAARFVPIPRGADGHFDPQALDVALRHGFCIVRWHVNERPPPG